MIRSIETARIFDFEEFPKRDKVRIEFWLQNKHGILFLFHRVDITLQLFAANLSPRGLDHPDFVFRSPTCIIQVGWKSSMKISLL